jgi:hypothetical protein
MNDTAAPESACPGLTGEGTIKWLFLKDGGLSVGGVQEVYRVETAGGMAPQTCKGRPASFEVKYVAQCEYSRYQLWESCANFVCRLDFWTEIDGRGERGG